MKQVTARDANQQFSQILSLVEAGEEILITKHGRPVAVMTSYRACPTDPQRQAAIERAIAVMNEPVSMEGEFRAFSRDEMHER